MDRLVKDNTFEERQARNNCVAVKKLLLRSRA